MCREVIPDRQQSETQLSHVDTVAHANVRPRSTNAKIMTTKKIVPNTLSPSFAGLSVLLNDDYSPLVTHGIVSYRSRSSWSRSFRCFVSR